MSADQELFGQERIVDLLRARREEPAAALVEALHQAARGHIAGQDQPDDYTTIILKAAKKD